MTSLKGYFFKVCFFFCLLDVKKQIYLNLGGKLGHRQRNMWCRNLYPQNCAIGEFKKSYAILPWITALTWVYLVHACPCKYPCFKQNIKVSQSSLLKKTLQGNTWQSCFKGLFCDADGALYSIYNLFAPEVLISNWLMCLRSQPWSQGQHHSIIISRISQWTKSYCISLNRGVKPGTLAPVLPAGSIVIDSLTCGILTSIVQDMLYELHTTAVFFH